MKNFVAFIFLYLLFVSCEKKMQEQRIPISAVRFVVDLNREYPGNGKAYTQRVRETDCMGYSGLYVVHTYTGEYSAFDLCCPVEVRKSVIVRKIDSTGRVRCFKCGSVFDVLSGIGYPISGPANEKGYSLQRYAVKEMIDNTLFISN